MKALMKRFDDCSEVKSDERQESRLNEQLEGRIFHLLLWGN